MKVFLTLFFILGAITLSFFQDDVIKDIFHYMFFPFFMGVIWQSFFLQEKTRYIIDKALFISLAVFLIAIVWVVYDDKNTIVPLIIMGWFTIPAISHYMGDRSRYIMKFSFYTYIIKASLFVYFLGFYYTLPSDLLTFVYAVLFFIWCFIWIGVLVRWYQKWNKRWIVVLMNVTWVMMGLLIGLYYLIWPIFSFSLTESYAFNPNIYTSIDFLVMGVSIWYILQQILMLGWYLPWKHQRDWKYGIRYANWRFLERMPENTPEKKNIYIFLSGVIVYFLGIHYYLYSSIMTTGHFPEFPSIWTLLWLLFVGWWFIWSFLESRSTIKYSYDKYK